MATATVLAGIDAGSIKAYEEYSTGNPSGYRLTVGGKPFWFVPSQFTAAPGKVATVDNPAGSLGLYDVVIGDKYVQPRAGYSFERVPDTRTGYLFDKPVNPNALVDRVNRTGATTFWRETLQVLSPLLIAGGVYALAPAAGAAVGGGTAGGTGGTSGGLGGGSGTVGEIFGGSAPAGGGLAGTGAGAGGGEVAGGAAGVTSGATPISAAPNSGVPPSTFAKDAKDVVGAASGLTGAYGTVANLFSGKSSPSGGLAGAPASLQLSGAGPGAAPSLNGAGALSPMLIIALVAVAAVLYLKVH